MATYNVRNNGTAALAVLAVGDIIDDLKCMTMNQLTTALNAGSFPAGSEFLISGRDGVLTATANLLINQDNNIVRGEDGYRPIIDCGGASIRVKVQDCNNTLLENFEIRNSIANGVEWVDTGTGHVIRDVHSHDNTGTGVAAFSNELTDAGATVTAYNLIGNNCTDDGWSSHDDSITTLYGGNFYGNAQGINHVATSTLNFYGVKSFGNSDFDYGATGAGLDSTANFYDCEFGGAVVGADQDLTTCTVNFYRTKFHCNAISTLGGFTTGCVHFAKNSTRTAHVFMESCEFSDPPSTKHCLLMYGSASTFNGIKCSVNLEISGVATGFWFATAGTQDFTVTDCNFYNCLNGVLGSNGTISSSNFDNCTADINGSGNTIPVANTSVSSGFEQTAIGDFRLASGSALIGAGTTLSITHDVENRPYSTADIGCYADTTARPSVSGRRPPV